MKSHRRLVPLLMSAAALLSGVPACGGSHGGSRMPSIIRFGSPSFSAGEGESTLIIRVSRTGSTRGSVTVSYASSDLTAAGGEDYTPVSDSLQWDDGDGAEKTFAISIIEDACPEGDETLEVSLGVPKGSRAVLGEPKVATVTITDNDTIAKGVLDPGFGTGGIVSSNPSSGPDLFTAIALDATSLYAVGFDGTPGGKDTQWRMEKRSIVDGSPDPVFGVVTSNPDPGRSIPYAVVTDGSFLFVAGYDEDPVTADGRWRLEKRGAVDGALDPLFGTGGAVEANLGPDSERILDVAMDGTGLYLVGDDSSPGTGDWQWRMEKRSPADGSLDPAFGTVTSNPSPLDDMPFGIAVDGSSLYVAGYDESPGSGDWQWRIEKRSLADGALDPLFGAVTSNPSTGDDTAYAVTLDASHVYIVGYDETAGPSDWEWRMEKRDLGDGTLDPGFGTGGIITEDLGTGGDDAGLVLVEPPYLYVAGSDSSPGLGDSQWRIIRLFSLDGSPDPCFGTGGVVTSNPGTFSDHPWGIALGPSSIFIVGLAGAPGTGDPEMRIEKRTR